MDLKAQRMIKTLALKGRPGAEERQITAMPTFHRHCVQYPLAWNPHLQD